MTTDVEAGKPEHAWRIVAGREMSVKVRDRGFLISTLVTLAIIFGSIGIQAYIGSRDEEVTVAAVGAESGAVIRQAVSLAGRAGEDVKMTWTPKPSEAAVRAAVLSGDVDAGLLPTAGGWLLLGKTDRNSTAAIWIGAAVQQSAVARNAAAAGTSIADLSRDSAVGYTLLSPDETPETVSRVTTFVFAFLFYLAAILLGVSLATSIVEEKQSRIVEIIASSIRVRDLLVGKIIGSTVIALGQMLVFALAGIIALLVMGKSETLSQITPGLGWFLVFFTIGIAVLACVYAATGALATRIEDIQSTTTPVTALIAVIFIAGISVSGPLQTVLSFVPLSSTITMPARIVSGAAAWWEPVISVGISLVVAGLIVQVSERVYRRALMQTGGKLSIRQALKLQD